MTLLAFARHLAFVAALALVSAMVVAAMISARVMDVPNARSAHARPTPKGGGVGIVVAFMLGITVLYGYADFSRLAEPYFRGVIVAALAIAVVAFLDDLKNWPFLVKLAAQTLAALAAAGSGLYVHILNLPYFGPVDIGWFGLVLTLGWILFATNAMNFIDGLNGLAGGTVLVACLFLAWLAGSQGAWFVYFAALLLAAGVLGFLPFNFPRARIFMGDVGSQFCGFVLAVLGVVAARFERHRNVVPAGALPAVRRAVRRRLHAGPPRAGRASALTEAHRGHLYQVAQRAGMDARLVAVLHWGFAALGGAMCLVFVAAPSGIKPLLPPLLLIPQLIWLAEVAVQARRAGLGAGDGTRASATAPAAKNTTITAMPARWLSKAAVASPSAAGPKKPVIRPDSANRPNQAARASAGAMWASRLRLAACAGPTNRPSAQPSTQNSVWSWISSTAVPSAVRHASDTSTAALAPIRSSMKAKPSAPSPAATFSAMPNSSTCDGVRPNCPAA